MAPAGQAWSTVSRPARWADFLATGHPEVLAPATLAEMATARPAARGTGLGLRLIDVAGRRLTGHTGSMPGFLASLFVDRETRDGSVAADQRLHRARSMEAVPERCCSATTSPTRSSRGRPSDAVPGRRRRRAGPVVLGQHRPRAALAPRPGCACTEPGDAEDAYEFEVRGDRIVGTEGYHRGETLHVHRRADGSVSHLVCATFVYTRIPYDPDVPIPAVTRSDDRDLLDLEVVDEGGVADERARTSRRTGSPCRSAAGGGSRGS